MNKEYKEFLENKIVVAESFGFEPVHNLDMLFPHQNDIVNWCIEGGRRAIFASFGLGKTFMQLSIANWRSSGDRFMSFEELQKYDMKRVYNNWKEHQKQNIYDFRDHLQACRDLDDLDKLSRLFMTLPTISNNDLVWTDINRMNTLNANQANKKKEKHICPLQLDIIERCINRFSMKTDSVFDPFGGIFSTPYIASKLGRESRAHELKKEYFEDGVFHLKALEYKLSVPTLFDVI